jgi:hypothetical protein
MAAMVVCGISSQARQRWRPRWLRSRCYALLGERHRRARFLQVGPGGERPRGPGQDDGVRVVVAVELEPDLGELFRQFPVERVQALLAGHANDGDLAHALDLYGVPVHWCSPCA